MAVSESYLAFVLDQMDGLAGIVTKRMFGGVGIYSEGRFFAVVDNDTLFFKVDQTLAERYRAKGMPPFMPIPGVKPMTGYYQVPPDVIEDRSALVRWAKDSVGVAGTAKPQKKPATASARKGGRSSAREGK